MEINPSKMGKKRPMPKAEYLRHIASIRIHFPWTSPVFMYPPPGHMHLVTDLLNKLDSLFGDDVQTTISSFMLLDQQGKLLAKMVISDSCALSYEQDKSAAEYLHQARIQSMQTCAICGDTRDVKVFCRLHLLAGRAGLRYAEELKAFSVNPYRYRPLPTEPSININDLPPLPGEQNYRDSLRIKLFDPACLSPLQKRADTLRDEQKSRITSAIERMTAAGADGYRSLGVFNDGAALVAEFIERFPNFGSLGELLAECAALYKLSDNRVKLPPVLLVGPAGVGKTEAASYLANAVNIGFRVVDMASTQTSCSLSGSDAMWVNSQEGDVFKALCYERVANPIILLDEIDKISRDSKYDPMGPLYSLLEVTTSRRFCDQSLKEVTLDASHINWIATANDISAIPKPILSRFIVFEIEPPSPAQARVIARNIYKGLRANADWGDHFPEFVDEAVVDQLVLMPPRGSRVALQRAFGAAAKAGRKALLPEDIFAPPKPKEPVHRGFGFMSPI